MDFPYMHVTGNLQNAVVDVLVTYVYSYPCKCVHVYSKSCVFDLVCIFTILSEG